MTEPHDIKIQNLVFGDIKTIQYQNLGWSTDLNGYVSKFSYGERITFNVFTCEYHLQYECPTPAVRLVSDQHHIETQWYSILVGDDE